MQRCWQAVTFRELKGKRVMPPPIVSLHATQPVPSSSPSKHLRKSQKSTARNSTTNTNKFKASEREGKKGM